MAPDDAATVSNVTGPRLPGAVSGSTDPSWYGRAKFNVQSPGIGSLIPRTWRAVTRERQRVASRVWPRQRVKAKDHVRAVGGRSGRSLARDDGAGCVGQGGLRPRTASCVRPGPRRVRRDGRRGAAHGEPSRCSSMTRAMSASLPGTSSVDLQPSCMSYSPSASSSTSQRPSRSIAARGTPAHDR